MSAQTSSAPSEAIRTAESFNADVLDPELYSGKDAYAVPAHRSDPVDSVKHIEPAKLLPLEAFHRRARSALFGFFKRYHRPNQTWMRQQHYYVELAALAAAYECMVPVIGHNDERFLLKIDDYDAVRLLNCGWYVGKKEVQPVFFRCGDPHRCPSCNNTMRVEPVKHEFLSCFDRMPFWYGLTLSATNDPSASGVHLEVGRDEQNHAIYKDLFCLDAGGGLPRLPRFTAAQPEETLAVALTVFNFSHWLTEHRVFSGLAVVGDIKFAFFPDSTSPMGCSHTHLPHVHGFGNVSHLLGKAEAERMYAQYLKMLLKAGGGRLVAYPDICLNPCPTEAALEKTINYAIKPYKLPEFYIEGLSNGCPVVGLNWEFHQVAWTCEAMFPNDNHVIKWGNMHVCSPDYDFVRQYRKMTGKQVKDYLEQSEEGSTSPREDEKYRQHQLACEQQRKHRRQRNREHLAEIIGPPSMLKSTQAQANEND